MDGPDNEINVDEELLVTSEHQLLQNEGQQSSNNMFVWLALRPESILRPSPNCNLAYEAHALKREYLGFKCGHRNITRTLAMHTPALPIEVVSKITKKRIGTLNLNAIIPADELDFFLNNQQQA